MKSFVQNLGTASRAKAAREIRVDRQFRARFRGGPEENETFQDANFQALDAAQRIAQFAEIQVRVAGAPDRCLDFQHCFVFQTVSHA
jgi:hypothetical protein